MRGFALLAEANSRQKPLFILWLRGWGIRAGLAVISAGLDHLTNRFHLSASWFRWSSRAFDLVPFLSYRINHPLIPTHTNTSTLPSSWLYGQPRPSSMSVLSDSSWNELLAADLVKLRNSLIRYGRHPKPFALPFTYWEDIPNGRNKWLHIK